MVVESRSLKKEKKIKNGVGFKKKTGKLIIYHLLEMKDTMFHNLPTKTCQPSLPGADKYGTKLHMKN